MTRVYVARLSYEYGKDMRIPRKVYTEAARRLLAQAVEREYSLDVTAYAEKKGENRKPYLEGAPFRFNLSHSGEYVVCALSDSDVGVDIEEIKPISEGVMRRFVGYFENSDAENTRRWTRYEAIGKCLGTGIPYQVDFNEYVIKEYFDLAGYALSVCSAKDEFAEQLVMVEIV